LLILLLLLFHYYIFNHHNSGGIVVFESNMAKSNKKQQQQQRKRATLPLRKVAKKTAKQQPTKRGIQYPKDATSQFHIQTILIVGIKSVIESRRSNRVIMVFKSPRARHKRNGNTVLSC
jgi:hypothetical protein